MKKTESLVSTNTEDIFYKRIIVDKALEELTLHLDKISDLSSMELYQILLLGKNNSNLDIFLFKYHDLILNKCIRKYDLYDYLSILILMEYKSCNEDCVKYLKKSVYNIFATKTILFLRRIGNLIRNDNKLYDSLFNIIIDKLSEENTVNSSKILIDLCHFLDFKEYLSTKYPTVEFIISKNLESYPLAKGRKMVLGGSIIGKLVRSNHENIIDEWIEILQNVNFTPDKSVNMIGAASTCLVFKIGDYVLKIGENRHTRKIFINHRILASQHRKYHFDDTDNPLFYTETMRFANVGNVTEQERDELVCDLYNQGLIWHDSKLENCGVLYDDDDNVPNMEVDYEEVAGHIDEPGLKYEFSKRKRRVVVIDNDFIDSRPKIIMENEIIK